MEIYYERLAQVQGFPESVEFDAIVIGSEATGGWAADHAIDLVSNDAI